MFNYPEYDVCIIGAGPAGITAALELANEGLSVVLIESGIESFDKNVQGLSDAEILNKQSHVDMSDAVQRGLGGTSALWGGRCVPLDLIDYENRSFVAQSGWPISHGDIQPFYERACQILSVNDASFSVNVCQNLEKKALNLSEHLRDTDVLCVSDLERWSTEPNLWTLYGNTIYSHPLITVLSGSTCIGFRQESEKTPVTKVLFRKSTNETSQIQAITAKFFILACGGVETTRLVLNSIRDPLGLKISSEKLVGHYYMGHPYGKIAEIELFGDPKKTIYGFESDGGVYVRRRLTLKPNALKNHELLNIAFWLENPPLKDWRHRSGILSAAYLALNLPVIGRLLAPNAVRKRIIGYGSSNIYQHILNCIKSPLTALKFCTQFYIERYLSKPRIPGFFVFSATNRYALHYHSEQIPKWENEISLSAKLNSDNIHRAKINLEWSTQDIESIIKAHRILDQEIRRIGAGRLIYYYPVESLSTAIREQAVDGVHQIGTLRMSSEPSSGVTDKFGCLYGAPNCFIASSAIFPTSGQANPTLTLVALVLRQAKYIAQIIKSGDKSG